MWAVATATSSSFAMSAESNTVMCIGATYNKNTATTIQFNKIQDYLYSPFYDAIVKSNFTGNYVSKIDLYCKNSIKLT